MHKNNCDLKANSDIVVEIDFIYSFNIDFIFQNDVIRITLSTDGKKPSKSLYRFVTSFNSDNLLKLF